MYSSVVDSGGLPIFRVIFFIRIYEIVAKIIIVHLNTVNAKKRISIIFEVHVTTLHGKFSFNWQSNYNHYITTTLMKWNNGGLMFLHAGAPRHTTSALFYVLRPCPSNILSPPVKWKLNITDKIFDRRMLKTQYVISATRSLSNNTVIIKVVVWWCCQAAWDDGICLFRC